VVGRGFLVDVMAASGTLIALMPAHILSTKDMAFKFLNPKILDKFTFH